MTYNRRRGCTHSYFTIYCLTIFFIFLTLGYISPINAFAQTRYGLFVGIDSYNNPSNNLLSCVNDAVGFRNSLLSDTGLWQLANTVLITDEDATEAAIKAQIAYFAGVAVAGDLFVFFQSSHGGGAGTTDDSYLYCHDGTAFRDTELASSLYPLFTAGVNVIAVVDADHSGGLIKTHYVSANVAFITSADYDESFPRGAPYSVYTGYLNDGFVAADGSGDNGSVDGDITFGELFEYTYPLALSQMTPQYYNLPLLESVVAVSELSVPASDPYEPDNDFDDAKVISDGEKQWRSILSLGDMDYATFTLSESLQVNVSTDGTVGDTELFLYDSTRSQISSDDNSGKDFFSSITKTLAAGTYYVMIQEQGADATIEGYSLYLRTSAPINVFPWTIFMPAITSNRLR